MTYRSLVVETPGMNDGGDEPISNPANRRSKKTILPHVGRDLMVSRTGSLEDFARVPAGPARFRLITDSGNPSFPQEIEVRLLNRRFGYLHPSPAASYRPILEEIAGSGEEIWVEGTIIRANEWDLSARFTIPWPDQLSKWVATPVRRRSMVRLERIEATVRGLADHQDELAAILDGRSDIVVPAELEIESVTSGKYKGLPLIRITHNGVTLGFLPTQLPIDDDIFLKEAQSGSTDAQVHIVRYRDTGRYWAKAFFD